MLDALNQVSKVKSVKVVVFTGGETTLYLDQLLTGISTAKNFGLLTRIVTNGWWADTELKARKMLTDLKNAGLDEINTSYDDYHAPFMKIKNIAILVKVALELGFKTIAVATIVDNTSKYSSDKISSYVAKYVGISEKELREKVLFLEDFVTPAGRGTGLSIDSSRVYGNETSTFKSGLSCQDVVKTISIHPSGDVKACCGHAMMSVDDLIIGNLNNNSLDDLINLAQKNIVYWWTSTRGPKKILEKIGVDGEFTSICDACRVLLVSNKERLVNYIKENKKEIVTHDILLSNPYKDLLQRTSIVLERNNT